VRTATDEYLAAEDAMAAWMEEQCGLDPNGYEMASDLYANWKEWTEKNGEYTGTARRFSQRLEDKGFVKKHTRTGASFIGLRLPQQPCT